MTVEEMLDRMSSAELSEWMLVFKLREQEHKKARAQAKAGG